MENNENNQINENFINTELVETNSKKFHINKNIILVIIIVILLIIAASLFFILKRPKETSKVVVQKFNNGDQTISLQVTSNFEFAIQHLDDYELSVSSSKYSSSIFISKVTATNVRDVLKYVQADKTDYISKFSNISDVSDVIETTVSGYTAYNYHFNYSSNMYVEVYIVPKDEYLYIIDFNINKDKQDLMDYLPEILNSVVL